LPDDTTTDAKAVSAMRFIDSAEATLIGKRVSRDQSLSFPRSGVVVDGWEWSSNEIPRNALLLQLSLMLDLAQGVDIYNPEPAKAKKREKVDSIEVEYFGPSDQKLGRQSQTLALLSSLQNKRGLYSVKMVRT